MLRQLSRRFLLAITFIAAVLVFSGTLFAQGRSEEAFERVKAVQERHTQRLMAINDVEGTAIGLDENNDEYALKVFTARTGVGGIPNILDGVPVRIVVTGKFYAFPKPEGKPGGGGGGGGGKGQKDRIPPAAPTGLTATTFSSNQINLTWSSNSEGDLDQYNVHRSTTSGGSYSKIGSAPKESPAYSDNGLSPSTTYYYVVTAVDTSHNESANSDPASATTDSGPVEPPMGPRPAPIGVSTGHPLITAGTLGCRVTKNNMVFALSNNHVYANSNNAVIGDNVLQPGRYDGGQDPRDAIGTLYDFATIDFSGGTNVIDAAIALCPIVNLGNATPAGSYGVPKSTPYPPGLYYMDLMNLPVQKHGRTTGLTHGFVYSVLATVNVNYGTQANPKIATFVEQIIILENSLGNFSLGGDSGSLIVSDPDKQPVGLLFAGGSIYGVIPITIANPIEPVLDYFGVSVDGE